MRRVWLLAAGVTCLMACTAGTPAYRVPVARETPQCPSPTAAPDDIHIPGLIVPPGSVLLSQRPTGQRLINVRGYVDITPLEVFAFYKRLKQTKKYDFFLLENEVIEAEAFFTDGKHRNYITARTACPGRSDLFLFVAPEDYSKSPGGSAKNSK